MTRVFIVAGKRTAFGAFGGALKGLSATQLATHATKGALAAGGVSPDIVDTCVVGNVQQTSADAAYLARHVALKTGMPISVSALTINRLCGSGFQSCINVAHEIKLGEAEVGVASGTESMSQAPMSVYGHEIRWGTRLGVNAQMQDTLWAGLTDSHAQCPMGVTAENLASDFGISRAESDAFAVRSQERWAAANAAGTFKAEIEPIELKSKKGPVSAHSRARMTPAWGVCVRGCMPRMLLTLVGYPCDRLSLIRTSILGSHHSTRWPNLRPHSRKTASSARPPPLESATVLGRLCWRARRL